MLRAFSREAFCIVPPLWENYRILRTKDVTVDKFTGRAYLWGMNGPDDKGTGEEMDPALRESLEAAGDLAAMKGRRETLQKYNREERTKMLRGIVKEYELVRKIGPLISQAGAAKVLNLSTSQVQRLCEEMRIHYVEFEFLGVRGVLVRSLEAFRKARVREGFLDAVQELRNLEHE